MLLLKVPVQVAMPVVGSGVGWRGCAGLRQPLVPIRPAMRICGVHVPVVNRSLGAVVAGPFSYSKVCDTSRPRRWKVSALRARPWVVRCSDTSWSVPPLRNRLTSTPSMSLKRDQPASHTLFAILV